MSESFKLFIARCELIMDVHGYKIEDKRDDVREDLRGGFIYLLWIKKRAFSLFYLA